MSKSNLNPSILREYDIRGVVNETLAIEDAEAIGRSFGTMIINKGGISVCVGYDGRFSSPKLEEAVVMGLQACGLLVIRIGLGPTPMLYFAVHDLSADAGIMVTGSHNPPEYNGFKMMLHRAPFYGEDIIQLGEIVSDGKYVDGKGEITQVSVNEKYITRLLSDYVGERPLKVAWDAGNGSAGQVMQELCTKLPGDHILVVNMCGRGDKDVFTVADSLGVVI